MLENKTAVITGGNGQIARSTALALARQGARVVLLVRKDLLGATTFVESMLPGTGHLAMVADVTDTYSLRESASKIGCCDILINCAGFTQSISPLNLHELTDEIFDKIVRINLHGTYATIREFGDLLTASGDGLIINITSAAGLKASSSCLAYGASKAGVDLLTKSLAVSMAPTVRVISIAPGYLTEGVSGSTVTPEKREWMASITPMNRVGTANEIADAIVAYATTIKFTTGAIVVLDGGRTL